MRAILAFALALVGCDASGAVEAPPSSQDDASPSSPIAVAIDVCLVALTPAGFDWAGLLRTGWIEVPNPNNASIKVLIQPEARATINVYKSGNPQGNGWYCTARSAGSYDPLVELLSGRYGTPSKGADSELTWDFDSRHFFLVRKDVPDHDRMVMISFAKGL